MDNKLKIKPFAVRAGSGKIVHASDKLVPGCTGAFFALCGSMQGVRNRAAGFLQVYDEINCPDCLAIMASNIKL